MADCREHRIVSDVALFVSDRVLFVRYRDTKKYDGEAGWFLPDDFMRRGEHPAEAGLRILEEQVGFTADHVALSHIESFTGGPDDAWHIVFHFVAGAASEPRLRSSKSVAKAEWFPADGLPARSEVAHHGWALDVLSEIRKSR